MKIRKAKAKDHPAIDAVVKAAFDSAEHADGNEPELVSALREDSAYLPELSCVAEENGKIIGHILFIRAMVGTEPVLALAPLSVLPEYQRTGVGTALVEEGHKIARRLGYGYSVVLGSEGYYPRFGYVPADTFGIAAPFAVPRENFMACKLQADAAAVSGVMTYAEAFGLSP